MNPVPLLLLCLLPLAAPAQGRICTDLWVIRNTLFNRQGFCFASPLGEAVFDNSDCTTRAVPTLSPRDRATVAEVLAVEDEWDCALDTGTIDIAVLRRARALAPVLTMERLPVPTGYESGCMGYLGPPRAIRSAPGNEAPQVAEVVRGDDLLFTWGYVEDWAFLSFDDGRAGWLRLPERMDKECAALAG